jgi:predicted nucleic acid-binding protein
MFRSFLPLNAAHSRDAAQYRPDEIAIILRELEATGEVVPITTSVIFRGLDAMPRHGLSFWDALIWAAAAENGVEVIYTEDSQDGRNVEGVLFINPFLPESSTTS